MKNYFILALIIISLILIAACNNLPQDNGDSTYELTIETEGVGEVDLSPEGGNYEKGTEVTLKAKPEADFKVWGDGLSGNKSEEKIVMDDNYRVIAEFYEKYIFQDHYNPSLWLFNENGGEVKEITKDMEELKASQEILPGGRYYLPEQNRIIVFFRRFVEEGLKKEVYSYDLIKGKMSRIFDFCYTKDDEYMIFDFPVFPSKWKDDYETFIVHGGRTNERDDMFSDHILETMEIYEFDPVSKTKTKITDNETPEMAPIYSSDKGKIIFSSVEETEELTNDAEDGASLDLYMMDLNGEGRERIGVDENLHLWGNYELADNKILMYGQRFLDPNEAGEEKQEMNFLLLDLNSNRISKVEDYLGVGGSLNRLKQGRDGEVIYLGDVNAEDYAGKHYIIDNTGELISRVNIDSGELYNLKFSPDNSQLIFYNNHTICLADIETGEVSTLVEGFDVAPEITWSRNGDSILYSQEGTIYSYNLSEDSTSTVLESDSEDWNVTDLGAIELLPVFD